MKIKKTIKSLLIVFLLTMMILSTGIEVKATNYKTVGSFPSTIGSIQSWDLGAYNGSEQMPFKYDSSQGVAAYCTKWKLGIPSGQVCTLNNSSWSEAIQAGVAYIIKQANSSNGGMSANYYYAELAINLFLYTYNGKDSNHLSYDYRNFSYILGNYYSWYTGAGEIYEKINSINKNNIATITLKSGSRSHKIVDTTVDSVTNVYTIGGSGDAGKYSVYFYASSSLPEGVSVELTTSKGSTTTSLEKITGLSSGDTMTITVKGLTSESAQAQNFRINVYARANMNYDIAANYSCGYYQSLTPNVIKVNSVEGAIMDAFNVKTPNAPKYPDLNITKVDDTGKVLEGAVFKITENDDQDNFLTRETGADGIASLEDLQAGEYCVEEFTAPSGYAINNEKHCFSVSIDNQNNISVTEDDDAIEYSDGVIKMTYTDYKTKISLAKVDKDGNYVPGATLKVVSFLDRVYHDSSDPISSYDPYVLNGEELRWVSGSEPKIIEGLPVGFYYLVEESAPSGYILDPKPVLFRVGVNEDPTVTLENKEIVLQISKVDITTKKELPGATLRLLDVNGDVVTLNGQELVWESTNESKIIKGLPAGTYYLEETRAPEGYALMTEKIKFILGEDGLITIDETVSDDSVIIMTNEHTKVYISKQDITTKEELPGAHLQIFDQDGNLVEEWDSTTEPHYIEGLPAGTYTLIETIAPEGYSLSSEEVIFTINNDGTITGDTVMYNTPIPDVPNTLSTKSILITIGGIALVGAGLGFYLYGFKKKKRI